MPEQPQQASGHAANESGKLPESIGGAGRADEFERLSRVDDPGIVREFVDFLKYNKKWWLTPIIVVTLLLIGAAILLPSPVLPFIYTLF